jgi:hypothetical protein
MAQAFATFAPACITDLVRQGIREPGEIELMAQAVVEIAPADWALFEALVNEPRCYAADLA